MSDLLPVEEAQDRLLSQAQPLREIETLALANAEGRVLASDLTARVTQPPFDASAMDGYALAAEGEVDAGRAFTLVGTAAAGHPFEEVLQPGHAVRIFTGAPCPPGADTILLQEDAVSDGTVVHASLAVPAGRHIRRKGQDFRQDEVVLQEGLLLDYSRLMLAAAANCPTLSIYRRPRVGILATGDELVLPGGVPGPGQIIASSGIAVSALAKRAGADVVDLGIAADNKSSLQAAVAAARKIGVDVLVTLGGASVGDHDLVRSALVEAGMELDFWRIAMRPGKPLMVGKLDGIHVLGLPGNPVSTLVCALLFLEPLIRRLGHLPPLDRLSRAKTITPLKANDRRRDYMRARLETKPDGSLWVEAFGKQDSSMMRLFAASDCLAVRAPNAPALEAGEACPIILLRV